MNEKAKKVEIPTLSENDNHLGELIIYDLITKKIIKFPHKLSEFMLRWYCTELNNEMIIKVTALPDKKIDIPRLIEKDFFDTSVLEEHKVKIMISGKIPEWRPIESRPNHFELLVKLHQKAKEVVVSSLN